MGCMVLILMFFGGFLGFFGISSSSVEFADPVAVAPTAVVAIREVTPTPTFVPFEPVSQYADVPQSRTEDGAYVLGFEDAPITIVAFEDFLCPHCQRYQTTLRPFIEQYVMTGQAKFEFRMLPTQQTSPVVMGLAQCADDARPDTFWDAHDLLFDLASEVEQFDGTTAERFAEELNVDPSDLAPCATETTQHEIDTALAREVGVASTPTVMLRYADGELVAFPETAQPQLEDLAAVVEAAQ